MPNTRHASRALISGARLAGLGSLSLLIVSGKAPQKTLLLVDGSSYLYRAFHALPELKSPRGEPTGAIRGVLSMLRKLAEDYKADALACVFDARGPTFRDALYPQYKANRPSMPEPLAAQIEPLHEAVAALGWPVLAVEGVEADDVIATLAAHATRHGWRTVVSTGDKDLAQLVDEHVTLVNTMSNEILDVAGVRQKFGVARDRIVDYLALTGDAVDNVPGVDKVGPKTAAKWIQQYGSLDEVMRHAAEIGGAVGANLTQALDWLPKGRELLTVKRDVELALALEDLNAKPDVEKQRALYERFGFRTWLAEVGSKAAPAPVAEAPAQAGRRTYGMLADEAALQDWLQQMEKAELVGFDTETTGLEPMVANLVGMSFAFGERAAYLPLAHQYPGAPDQVGVARALALLKPWLESARHRKVGQNLKFDAHVLANHGVALAGIAHDTLLQSYVLEVHERHDLDSLSQRHLGWKTIGYDEVTGKGAARIPFSSVSVERAAEYAAEDADCALAVHAALYPRIAAEEKLKRIYETIELPVLPVLLRMERNGVLLDREKLEAQSHELGKEMLELEQKAYGAAGQPFNLNSPKQIQEILFDKQGLPVKKKTPKGQPSTDEDVLEELALEYPLPRLLLEYRGIAKLKSTYTDKLPKMIDPRTGRVHTTYSQAVAFKFGEVAGLFDFFQRAIDLGAKHRGLELGVGRGFARYLEDGVVQRHRLVAAAALLRTAAGEFAVDHVLGDGVQPGAELDAAVGVELGDFLVHAGQCFLADILDRLLPEVAAGDAADQPLDAGAEYLPHFIPRRGIGLLETAQQVSVDRDQVEPPVGCTQ
jgi:DNA polymerase-1